MAFWDVFNSATGQNAPGATSGTYNPYGGANQGMRQEALGYGGIDPAAINQQAQIAGQQQRQQNISGYNAALASQRGVNPTLAATGMGNNLANVNAQTGAQTQNIQAQNTWQAQQANQNYLQNYYALQSQNYNQAHGAGLQAQTAAANRGSNLLGTMLGSDMGQKQPISGTGSGWGDFYTGAAGGGGITGGLNSYLSNGQETRGGVMRSLPYLFSSSGSGGSDASQKQPISAAGPQSGGDPGSSGGEQQPGILEKVLPAVFGAVMSGSDMGGKQPITANSQVGGYSTSAMAPSDREQKAPSHHEILKKHLYGGQGGTARGEQENEMASQGPKAAEHFMSTLRPQAFEYKPDGSFPDGQKPHVGVMAQDLEKTPYGASAVEDTPGGKMVDVKQLSMMLAAGLGDLHQRLSQLEGHHRRTYGG